MNERLGTPVVDELRLCYTAEPLLLEELSGVEVGGSVTIAPFVLFRVGGDRFEYMFTVCIGDIGSREEIATLKYGRYGAVSTQYVFFRVCNHVLYDGEKLRMTLSLPEIMGMYFNNFTALDIAVDYKKKISSIIKKMMRNDRIKTILKGTKIFSIVDELMERGIPVFSATSSYDARTADGRMMQGVELLMAEHDNSVKSQAVRDSGAKALRSGRWIQAPPRGYDMKTTRAKQTITINADGFLIREAFLLKATENLTNEEVRKIMKTRGLDLSKQNWSHIFKNIFYAGYFSHPFLEGEIVEGPHEPLVSLEIFCKVNDINIGSHSRGYEVKSEKSYAPLLGLLRCPVCGHNLTSSLSTKMLKRYGREVGYYVCSHKNCRCNVSAKKVNQTFEDWLGGIALQERFTEVLEAQLRKSFPELNEAARNEVAGIRCALSKKESEIEKVEYNLAVASSGKIQEICGRQLEKLEEEKRKIEAELAQREQDILNLNDYLAQGMNLRNNILKMWQLSNLPHKRHLQEVVFPNGVVWSKENDDIEPLSKNEFLFTYGFKSSNYAKKEERQTCISADLSPLAPPVGLEPTTL